MTKPQCTEYIIECVRETYRDGDKHVEFMNYLRPHIVTEEEESAYIAKSQRELKVGLCLLMFGKLSFLVFHATQGPNLWDLLVYFVYYPRWLVHLFVYIFLGFESSCSCCFFIKKIIFNSPINCMQRLDFKLHCREVKL